ncbi:MAG: VOC family protein [Candidatus Falkowbacteria bacterium]
MIRVDHISIQTSNFETALKFYNEVLGFIILVDPFNFKTRKLCYLDAGNIRIELYSTKNGTEVQYNNQRGGLDHIAFITEDLEGLINRMIYYGIHVIKPPFLLETKAGVSFLAFVEGPDGQEIELRQESI